MYEQISRNKRRSALLVVVFVALVAAVVFAFNLWLGYGPLSLVVALAIAGGAAFAAWWTSDKVALAANRAQPADPESYARLHNLVEGLCIAGGLPKPRLYVVDDPGLNAFATGRNPDHAAIAVTTGLLATMNRVELEGVLAHELSHIKNYDILVGTIAVTFVGVIAILSDFALRWWWWGGSRSSRDSNGGGNVVFAIIGLAVLILAPLAAKLLQLAVSRRREALADASGVMLTRYPPGLIAALEKIRDNGSGLRQPSHASAHLWIASPFRSGGDGRRARFDKLFLTHPPIEERIAALQEM